MASAQKQHKPGVWTDDEDALLAQWQGRLGNKWSEVAKHIPGKTGQQCAQRWRHRVNPNISREKWAEEEDQRLAELVAKHGNSWAEISRCLPGRTDQQCMGRWRRHLDPSIRRESWEAAEDEQLKELYAEYGSSWSCISKSLAGRTAQQCRARWCQLTNAERPSRSTTSRSKTASTTTKAAAPGEAPGGGEPPAQQAAPGNPRRQSTANNSGAQPAQGAANPADLFAAAEGAAAAAGAHARRAAPGSQHRAAVPAGASRRLSTVSEVGAHDPSWSQGGEDEDSSPEFMVRKTTARTAGRAATSARGAVRLGSDANTVSSDLDAAALLMAAAGLPMPAHLAQNMQQQQQQHDHLQPPASAVQQQQQQLAAPAAVLGAGTAAAPAPVLPQALLPLKMEVQAGTGCSPTSEDDGSPALTENPGPHAGAAADLLSPLRAPLPTAPPLFTPSSSGRKRTAASRMAAFGPALAPLVIPDHAATVTKGTPMRVTPGSAPMSLELPSPNVLTLLQSPPPLMDDLFRSPGFGTMLTPPWAKSGSSGGSSGCKTAGGMSGGPRTVGSAGSCDEDRRQSVARRLDTAPSFGNPPMADAAQHQQQQAAGSDAALHLPAASFDFGVLLGSPPKKSRMTSPGASGLTAMTAAGTPWMACAPAGLVLQPAESGGGTSLAMAVQHHLLLASTAKAGPPGSAVLPGDKENGAEQLQRAKHAAFASVGVRQATLTAVKPAAQPAIGGSPAQELTSSSVRMKLHALLETV